MDGDSRIADRPAMMSVRDTPPRRVPWRMATFVLFACVPTLLAAVYLFGIASDQYVCEFRFSVSQSPATPMQTSSLTQSLASGTSLLSSALDSQIVVEYIQSHQILTDLDKKLDFDAIYAKKHADPLYRLDASASAERRLRYWRRMVDPYFDLMSGLVTVKLRAFSPAEAKRVGDAVLSLSEALVNRLSTRARTDRLAYSEAAVMAKRSAFLQAEDALGTYRNAHKILFPQIHAAENSTLDAGLSEQLTQAQTRYTTLLDRGVAQSSPQMQVLQTRIDALGGQLKRLQVQLANPDAQLSGNAGKLPGLATALSGYNAAEAEEQIAEHAYETSLKLQQQAESDAAQQQIYLNAFVIPNLPEDSLYPRRWWNLLTIMLASCALWVIGVLLFYGVREHLD